MRSHYDSRDNMIFHSDAQHSRELDNLIADPVGLFPMPDQETRGIVQINLAGNSMELFFDGINRNISEVHHLRMSGQGQGEIDTTNPANPDGLIMMDYKWDANSRLIAMADDGSLEGDQNISIGIIEDPAPLGNVTRYDYDDLNRLTQEVFDDLSCNSYRYDADDNQIQMVDENGSVITDSYDGIDRHIMRDVERATSETPHLVGCIKEDSMQWQVVGTTRQEYQYDGLDRLVLAFDNNEPEVIEDDSTVSFAYDSLSRRLEEVQNGVAISSQWMGDDNRVGLIYPNDRALQYEYDALDRIQTIRESGPTNPVVDYDYVGSSRVVERSYVNGTKLTYLDDTRENLVGYDGVKRTTQLRNLGPDSSLIVGFTHSYDRMNNKLLEEKLHDPDNSETYRYDSEYRLVEFERGMLGEVQANIENLTNLPGALKQKTWTLDGTHNWSENSILLNDSFGNDLRANQSRTHTSLHEIQTILIDGEDQQSVGSDDNGNLLNDGEFLYMWDPSNRLKSITRTSDNQTIANYSYDALNRRVRKDVQSDENLQSNQAAITEYYYDIWRVLEERSSVEESDIQFVYGNYIDEVLQLTFGGQTLFYHQDSQFSVYALTDDSGINLTTYQYDPYGMRTMVEGHSAMSINVEMSQNPYYFMGQRIDDESELYYFKNRYFSQVSGRFISRDLLGYWDGLNQYAFVQSNPLKFVDPLGKAACLLLPAAPWITETIIATTIVISGALVTDHILKNTEDSKPVNLPGKKKVKIETDDIRSKHTESGEKHKERMKNKNRNKAKDKDLWPDDISDKELEKAVREAYGKSKVKERQGESVRVEGKSKDYGTVEMWVNTQTKTIETAWPKYNSGKTMSTHSIEVGSAVYEENDWELLPFLRRRVILCTSEHLPCAYEGGFRAQELNRE